VATLELQVYVKVHVRFLIWVATHVWFLARPAYALFLFANRLTHPVAVRQRRCRK
jgi:hypothetical protein